MHGSSLRPLPTPPAWRQPGMQYCHKLKRSCWTDMMLWVLIEIDIAAGLALQFGPGSKLLHLGHDHRGDSR
eukprot:5463143-Pyramimonas_sp.AAC.1